MWRNAAQSSPINSIYTLNRFDSSVCGWWCERSSVVWTTIFGTHSMQHVANHWLRERWHKKTLNVYQCQMCVCVCLCIIKELIDVQPSVYVRYMRRMRSSCSTLGDRQERAPLLIHDSHLARSMYNVFNQLASRLFVSAKRDRIRTHACVGHRAWNLLWVHTDTRWNSNVQNICAHLSVYDLPTIYYTVR